MIESRSNPRIKKIRSLLERSDVREKLDAFVIEGIKLFEEAPEDRLRETYFSSAFHRSHPEIPGEEVQDDLFGRLSDVKTPQGILAVVDRCESRKETLLNGGTLMVLEGIQDPGNLGTILRTGEGAGISGVIMDMASADPYSPKAVRASMGSVFRVPFCRISGTEELTGLLRKAGYTLFAADARSEKSRDFSETVFPENSAIFIGNEGRGLKEETMEQCDVRVHIPMRGQLESLNAAVSAALLMYRAALHTGAISGY